MGNYYYAYSRQTIIHDELQELIDLVEHQNNPKISSLFNEMVKNSCTEEYLISEYYSKRNPLQALMFEYPNVIREYDGDYMEAYCVPTFLISLNGSKIILKPLPNIHSIKKIGIHLNKENLS